MAHPLLTFPGTKGNTARYLWSILRKSRALWLRRSEASSHCPNPESTQPQRAVYLDHTDPQWQANIMFWKSHAKKQEARNVLPFHRKISWATVDYISCRLCSPRVELSTEKSLPPIVTSEFVLSWLHFLFQLACQEAHKRVARLRRLWESHSPHACLQLLPMLSTFHLS